MSSDYRAVLREYIESLILAILVAAFLRAFVITAYKIPTESMLPTLKVGDFIFAFKLPYGFEVPFTADRKVGTGRFPERGEVIVFRHPKDSSISYIKRVVGLPGDKIEIKSGALWVNDREIQRERLQEVAVEGHPELELWVEKMGQRPYGTYVDAGASSVSYGPILVPPDQVFVLGDYRAMSDDSRHWGAVPLTNIEGRALFIWMSLEWDSQEGGYPSVRWPRLFQRVN